MKDTDILDDLLNEYGYSSVVDELDLRELLGEDKTPVRTLPNQKRDSMPKSVKDPKPRQRKQTPVEPASRKW